MRNIQSLTALRTFITIVAIAGFGIAQAGAISTVNSSLSYLDTDIDPYIIPAGMDAVALYDYSNDSNNSMFRSSNETVVVFARDENGVYSLSIVIDMQNDGSGGHLQLDISGATGATLDLVDDPYDFSVFDGLTGAGTIVWDWLDCCTDGAVFTLGTELPDNLCLSFTNATGVGVMRFCGYQPGTSNWLELTGMNPDETICLSSEQRTAATTELSHNFELGQAWPNPFNPTTNINFNLQETGMASLKVYDLRGRLVTTLVNGLTSAGDHTVTFDADGLSSGTYLYRLQSDNGVETRRMTLIK